MDFALKLLAAVGSGLEAFYSNTSSASSTSSSPSGASAAASRVLLPASAQDSPATCGYCIGNETQKLVEAVVDSVSALCSSAAVKGLRLPEPEDPQDKPAPLKHFCELYPKLRVVTALALLSRLEVQPLSLAVTRCANQGSCVFSPSPGAAGAGVLGLIKQVERQLDLEAMVHEAENLDAVAAETSAETVPPEEENPLDFGLSEDVETDCQECIVSGFKLVREVVGSKFHWVCANAKEPHIRGLCEFTREHPYLTMVGVVLKLRPWKKVVPGCFFLQACKAPSPPPGPPLPPPQPLEAVHVLPVFPHLDVDPFAPPPPPPPPPGMCVMGFLHRAMAWLRGVPPPQDPLHGSHF